MRFVQCQLSRSPAERAAAAAAAAADVLLLSQTTVHYVIFITCANQGLFYCKPTLGLFFTDE